MTVLTKSSSEDRIEIKIIEEADKENVNERNSLTLKRTKESLRFFDKARTSMPDVEDKSDSDRFFIEPSTTRLSSQSPSNYPLLGKRDSVDTMVIHRDDSCLSNVFDEFDRTHSNEPSTSL